MAIFERFLYSEKAAKICKTISFDVTKVISNKIGRFFSNFVAFSKYTNFRNSFSDKHFAHKF